MHPLETGMDHLSRTMLLVHLLDLAVEVEATTDQQPETMVLHLAVILIMRIVETMDHLHRVATLILIRAGQAEIHHQVATWTLIEVTTHIKTHMKGDHRLVAEILVLHRTGIMMVQEEPVARHQEALPGVPQNLEVLHPVEDPQILHVVHLLEVPQIHEAHLLEVPQIHEAHLKGAHQIHEDPQIHVGDPQIPEALPEEVQTQEAQWTLVDLHHDMMIDLKEGRDLHHHQVDSTDHLLTRGHVPMDFHVDLLHQEAIQAEDRHVAEVASAEAGVDHPPCVVKNKPWKSSQAFNLKKPWLLIESLIKK
eukprot:GHVU01166684.1.p2 GENE.GHVU01166684.1~~GHVU01166684.1.p2  ORF type:complete len:307 (+),score=34.17 GHVU01166684.1:587-1507(+)